MIIGIDFDNTIVCYDELFHKIAREQNLVPDDLPKNKSEVRNHLRDAGQEDKWTEMQGLVYGARISEATPYPGVMEFFRSCRESKTDVRIISHKTRHPFLGEQYDLHQAAMAWLELQGFFDENRIGLKRENVFLELTRAAKIQRLVQCGCTHFIDDLPEFLSEAEFPANVKGLLFDPNDLYSDAKFTRLRSWGKARELLHGDRPHDRASTDRDRIQSFLEQHGLRAGAQREALSGGGNNRVYRINSEGKVFALKEYFQNSADSRDRFGAEKGFYDFLSTQRNHRTPEALGWDTEYKLGLFSFVEGRKLSAGEINGDFVQQAGEFIVELNEAKHLEAARKIPDASEACFSVAEHLSCIERRVARLHKIEGVSKIDREAAGFVVAELEPAWRTIRDSILQFDGLDLEKPLSLDEKWLSPSDFGFHNALLPADGQLRFFDFEYAGWDDPAKLVCDFFCQPQVPVDRQFWNSFVETLAAAEQTQSSFMPRARLLYPAYQMKWCCIMLNEFVRGDQVRRDFAKGAETADERKIRQLEKVRTALSHTLRRLQSTEN